MSFSPGRSGKGRSRVRAAAAGLLALAGAGCGAPLQIFSSASESAASVTRLTWFMVILSGIIYVIVMAAMLAALARNRRRSAAERHGVDLSERGAGAIIVGGIALPALVLAAVFGVAETALGRYPDPAPALTIRVTGHQWWWELEYLGRQASGRVAAANELHVPVGRPVRLILTSADVIHSFWVPRLQGKLDLIPGDTNDLRLVVREPGLYRGQCAEFCGAQHANMAITVVAEDSASFSGWLAGQAAEAAAPVDSTRREGEHLFVTGPCAMCHTVRGTPAVGAIGPDLTHVAGRRTLAAGTVPNSLGHLEAWIANAQALKPGALMPTTTQFDGRELRAVAAYVAGLR